MTVKTFSIFICLITFLVNILLPQAIYPKKAVQGMVVTTNDIATRVGVDILKKGGNAIDATVATAFALAVTYPSCGNIGGDGFMLYYQNNGTCTAIDFRIKAPQASHPDMFFDRKNGRYKSSGIKNLHITDSILSIGVPGTVAGLELAHKKFGKLQWKDLLEPAIKLAKEGFPVGIALSKEMEESKKYIFNYPSSKKFLLKPNGESYKIGEIWKQPDKARTLKLIQKFGKDGFYKGEIAKKIIRGIQKHGGILTEKDLNDYHAMERTPVKCSYRRMNVYSMPLPSSGGITQALLLNILENFNLKEFGHNSARYIHHLTEAMRRAYRERSLHLGDPEFNKNIPIQKLISKKYAGELQQSINPLKASKSKFQELQIANEKMETTHFSIIDKDGNGVSLTTSQNGDFGSYFVPEGTGVVLNNTMGDFNLKPKYRLTSGNSGGRTNWIEPGKRPLSSMTPTLVEKDGKLLSLIGSPGGTTIISTNIQIILNLLEFKMNIAEATSAPRMYHGWIPDEILFQGNTISKDTYNILKGMGHNLKVFNNLYFGPAMCIYIDPLTNIRYGASDPRSRDGLAAGH